MTLETWIANTGQWFSGQKDDTLGGKLACSNYRGHTFKQLGRGSTLLSAVAGSMFIGFAKAVETTTDLADRIGRRAGEAPEVVSAVPQQSAFPGITFSLSLPPTNYFRDTDSGGFKLKVVEKGEQTLPSWLSIGLGGIQLVEECVIPKLDPVVSVVGHLAYFAGFSYGKGNSLEIINVSNPSTPTLVGFYDTPDAANDVHVVGNFAYLTFQNMGLEIIDVSNPGSPLLIGSYNNITSKQTEAVYVAENFAYLATYDSGLQIIDVSVSSIPHLAGSYSILEKAYDVVFQDNFVYVADYEFGLQIIDVSNPTKPTFVGAYNVSRSAKMVQVQENLAYLNFEATGLKIINVSIPTAPTLVGTYDTLYQPKSLHIVGNFAYIAVEKGMQIIDVSNPTTPTLIGAYTLLDFENKANDIHVIGNFPYLASGGGLSILEEVSLLTGIPSPSHVGNYELELIAEDPDQNQASSTFLLRVEGPPVRAGSISNRLANIAAPFSYFIDQSVFPDPNGDVVFYSAEKTDQNPMLSWLSFSSIGIFSGTPQLSDAGTFEIKISAYDGIVADRTDTTFSLTVEHFPEVSIPISNQAAATDQPYSFKVPAGTFTDQDMGDTLTYSAAQNNGNPLPSWLSFNPLTQTFSGTPGIHDEYSSIIRVSATDTPGATASTTFTLAVGEFPSLLNPIPDQLAAVGVPYLYSLPGNTFTTPPGEFLAYRASKADGSYLPAWLGFVGPRLEFQGTPQPSDRGNTALKVIAEDSKGGTATSIFNLNVVDALSQEIARIGGSFVYGIPDMISSPLGPVTYTVSLGDGSPLPIWLNYNPVTNVITGIPPSNSEGTYSILVSADDGVQTPVLGTLSITVVSNAAPKVANPLSNQVAQVEQKFRFVVPDNTFADPNDDSLILSAKRATGRSLPNWLTFTDRTLEGKPGPSDTGAFSDKVVPIQICATDGDQEACSVFDLSVQGTSNAERALSIFGPLIAFGGLAYGWFNKRGVILNPWNRKNYDKGTKTVTIGEPFNYQIETPKSKIKLVQAFEGKQMFAGLPAPMSLDKRGYLDWLKYDSPIIGGNLLPSWLNYKEGGNELISSSGPSPKDAGLYTVRAYGDGEVILEEIRLKVGDQSESGIELTARRGKTAKDPSSGMVPLLEDEDNA